MKRHSFKPKISVIMPAYNVARYIEEAIRSVLTQKGVTFELLIGNDASQDTTWEQIQNYKNEPRLRAWHFAQHCGAAAILNHLVKNARGSYIATCRADDALLPGHLRTLSRVLDRKPKIGVTYGNWLVKDEAKNRRFVRIIQEPAQSWDLIGGHVWNGGSLIRRSVLNKIGGHRNYPFMIDFDLALRLAEVTLFHHVDGKPLYLHRKRRGTLSDRSRQKEKRQRIGKQILAETIFRRYGFRVPWSKMSA